MGWSSADTLVVVSLLLFGLLGFLRGFIRVVFSILAFGLGILISSLFYRNLAELMRWIPISFSILCITAFLMLFLIVFTIVRVIAIFFHHGAQATALGWVNRLFGFFTGVIQGIIIIIAFVTIGLLSPTSEKFHEWASNGVIAPTFTSIAETLANKTRGATVDINKQFAEQMMRWGVNNLAIDKLFGDSALTKEMVKQGEQKQVPGAPVPPSSILYADIQKVLNDESLTTQQKAREIWNLIQTSQEKKPPAPPPSGLRSDPRYR